MLFKIRFSFCTFKTVMSCIWSTLHFLNLCIRWQWYYCRFVCVIELDNLFCSVWLILIVYHTLSLLSPQVTDQNLDVWQNSPACVPDALRHYYYQYLSSTTEAAEVFLDTCYVACWQVAKFIESLSLHFRCFTLFFSCI